MNMLSCVLLCIAYNCIDFGISLLLIPTGITMCLKYRYTCFISTFLWFVSLFGSKVLYLHFHIGVQHNFNARWCSCGSILPQRVSLEEREMLTLPEHLNSLPVFSGVRVGRSLVLIFCVVCCRSLSIRFLLAIVLSVRLLIIPLVS